MFDIIGDVHSCYKEFVNLLQKLGYQFSNNFFRPDRKVVLVGDIIDRGPDPISTLKLIKNMFESGSLLMVKGNHDDKLQRWANGNKVQLLHGLDKTIEAIQISNINIGEIKQFLIKLPYFLLLDNSKLVVTHAAWLDRYINNDPFNKRNRSYCLYGPTTGRLIDGFPERIDWVLERIINEQTPIIVAGHQPMKNIRNCNKVWQIDTGCVFGGSLSALRYPEMELIQEEAYITYSLNENW